MRAVSGMPALDTVLRFSAHEFSECYDINRAAIASAGDVGGWVVGWSWRFSQDCSLAELLTDRNWSAAW
jgi:hypothetical protein